MDTNVYSPSVPHRDSRALSIGFKFVGWSSVKLILEVGVESVKNDHTENLTSHQMTRQLTTRTCARLHCASPAGQSMDSVTRLGFLNGLFTWPER